MKKRLFAAFLVAGALLVPLSASAAPIKTFISAFTVTPQEASGLKESLQRLFASRMAGEGISTVDSSAEAQVVVTPSYTQIGKIFSLDAVAKLSSGETLASVFEQGEGQDDLIPALGRLSAKLRTETLQQYGKKAAAQGAPAAQVKEARPATAAEAAPAAALHEEPGTTLWMSQRIGGAQTSIAPAGTIEGAGIVFVAEGHKLRVYRQEKKLVLLAETSVPQREKIIAVDATGKESDGTLRAYLTIINDENPTSRVYAFERGALKLVAEKLPYMFRAVALNGGARKVYAQQMGRIDDYYGDVYEVSEEGGKIALKNPIKLPHYGNIFNFNSFTDAGGTRYFTVFSTDGYLVVYSEAGEELWRSPEKFGGSETYFQREVDARPGDEKYRWRFIDQRITVTPKGDVILPQNDGFFVLGNQRSYSKYAISCLTWNGSSMEERWKTKTTKSYLADYFFSPDKGELVLLEVVQKEGAFSNGGSAVRVIRAN